MGVDRIHRAASTDGTEIAGHVHGHGPPLVLVHGGVGSEESWRFLVPLLSQQFTCYPMSLRGRGLSAENPDQSPQRLIDDVVAFSDSIGGPVGLVGHSSGGALALAAASRAEHVTKVAVYEPALPEFERRLRRRYQAAFERMREEAAQGRLVEAAWIAFEDFALANDEELAVLHAADAADFVAANVPVHVREIEAYLTHQLLPASRLERLTMPVALLYGSQTHPAYKSIVSDLARELADGRLARIDGAGHMAPLLVPEAVADHLTRFFAPGHDDARGGSGSVAVTRRH